jgi:NAD(P)-dependent dehydrogenase (short-subunit alcohol dehydrogenase family)
MKAAIVTGASAGIGRATAELLLEDGWTVGLIARRAEKLQEIDHPNALPLPCDVTDAPAMEAALARFVAETGRLDLLFNNAGMFGPACPPDEVSVEAFDAVVAVNLRGMFIAARLAFAQMRAQAPQGGRIINNGSVSAHVPRENSICYTTTKHAITGMTRSLSLDGRALGIACGQIDIGNAETELVTELKTRQPDMPTMALTDAARAVLQMAQLPLSANVQFMTIMATRMAYIGRG